MTILVTRPMVTRLAGLELNALLQGKVFPLKQFDGARVTSAGTPIYDVNGELLFYRAPIRKGRLIVAYADIAAHSALGTPFLASHQGLEWNERELVKTAIKHARKHRVSFDRTRFVAFSYPKIALQFMKRGKETLMLELFSWSRIPPKRARRAREPPGHFERWSLIDEIPPATKSKNLRRFKKRISDWDTVTPSVGRPVVLRPEKLQLQEFKTVLDRYRILPRVDTQEIHYSTLDTDHHPCYELRGQQTSVWCVAASVQMILDFYRYNYAQTRLAQDLGLGTLTNPNGLPYSRVGDVVTVLQNLTSNALTVNMNTNPNWSEFKSEIRANRPLISFIWGHSRTVAGYHDLNLFPWFRFKGLLVYDPWPPNQGVITRWENFDRPPQAYTHTYSSQLTLV